MNIERDVIITPEGETFINVWPLSAIHYNGTCNAELSAEFIHKALKFKDGEDIISFINDFVTNGLNSIIGLPNTPSTIYDIMNIFEMASRECEARFPEFRLVLNK
ncbi:hypothetical protein [Acinetobacter phage AbTZA1]|uniref:Uncharacterized protein n=1 Tax=Acinetobacter phage AbTZA1 TaxID=2500827 RepID=A0A3Q9R7A3_9CAUD|nr:hypothetical protein HYP74_gp001 [Acinetobacter phage AbTZA1]AZU98696.1 hypothetical protein [Acinetobacter phage AbTZA1]QQO96293.1 hypothetical protein CPT_Minot_090 [Acinetobacter phage Minot]QQO96541.1 hypothetical protein CPT_Mokit_090 [Acinetobacter phage Mokit]QQO96796.1 hypothetical protein CPT_Melin_095 [Acinetobacter phage Melin]